MKRLLLFISLLVATSVVAQDYSSIIKDEETLNYYKDKNNHFSFMGISFCQSTRSFKSELKKKGLKLNSHLMDYYSNKRPDLLFYNGNFSGENASAIVNTHNEKLVYAIQITLNFKDDNVLESKRTRIIETIKEKYKYSEEITMDSNGNNSYSYKIYSSDEKIIGFISINIIEYNDVEVEKEYGKNGLSIMYQDYLNTKFTLEFEKTDI